MALVSIVVPVYNTARYLPDCVRSLRTMNTKYADIEIILVDDGSMDGSSEMCDGFAIHDHRIRVIHQANQGLSAARNSGIDASLGEYLMFVDSDDYVAPCALDYLMQLLSKHGADMVQGGFRTVDEYGKHLKRFYPPILGVLSKSAGDSLVSARCNYLIWVAIYSKATWDTLRFPAGSVFAEDSYTFLHFLQQANTVVFGEAPIYCYRQRSGSIMGSLTSQKFAEAMVFHSELDQLLLMNRDLGESRNVVALRQLQIAMDWHDKRYKLSREEVALLHSRCLNSCKGALKHINATAFMSLVVLSLPLPLCLFCLSLLNCGLTVRTAIRKLRMKQLSQKWS